MINPLEAKKLTIQRSPSSVFRLATSVMQDLQNKTSRAEIISNKLRGDVQLFDMISLFLYANRWLTRQNTMTEKGKVWLEMMSEPIICNI